MADSKKCDRCGGHYIPTINYNNTNLDYTVVLVKSTFILNVGECRKDYDLCPSCTLALQRWFNNPS